MSGRCVACALAGRWYISSTVGLIAIIVLVPSLFPGATETSNKKGGVAARRGYAERCYGGDRFLPAGAHQAAGAGFQNVGDGLAETLSTLVAVRQRGRVQRAPPGQP